MDVPSSFDEVYKFSGQTEEGLDVIVFVFFHPDEPLAFRVEGVCYTNEPIAFFATREGNGWIVESMLVRICETKSGPEYDVLDTRTHEGTDLKNLLPWMVAETVGNLEFDGRVWNFL